ncbi:uncharacterized protein KGF55_001552 [Candida pseudojiufengensis]|uniref:uncharacterized protein n=1 Tax=Candida pseudojiufengensis TaxID=497109 RepID=UPI0022253904|nr:uncharacterized protein KGF55_001552 [Candida pseudojiufengensis]KAI5965331.1 hypothetical protein KGF55_001552 [Candida pseudojiufengensis]
MTRSSRREISLREIKKHDQPNDLWMILYNKVYDLTEFTKYHIGGIEVLYDCGGSDATEAFEDVGHSDFAVEMLKPYLIGEVEFNERKIYHSYKSLSPEIEFIESITKRDDYNFENFNQFIIRKIKQLTNIMILSILAISSFILLILIQNYK